MWVSTQKYGKTPKIIHFLGFSIIFTIQFWSTPIVGNTHGIGIFTYIYQPFMDLDLGLAGIPWTFGGFHSNLGGGNSNIFYFHTDPWGNDPIWLAHIFQRGWFNHQLVIVGKISHSKRDLRGCFGAVQKKPGLLKGRVFSGIPSEAGIYWNGFRGCNSLTP